MRFLRSLGTQRLALIALIALPAILLTIRSGIERRDEAAERVRAQGLQLAFTVSQQAQLSVQGARDLLNPIAALFAESETVAAISRDTCTAFLSSFVGPDSEYVSVGLADAGGRVHCASAPLSAEVDVGDQPFFTSAMTGASTTVGHFAADRVSGMPALTVGWPVVRAGGTRTGVVFAAIDLERLQPAMLIESLPEGSFATVTDSAGTILARAPDPQHLVGDRILDPEVIEAITRIREGTAEGLSSEGVPSLIGFAPIEDFGTGAYAVIGIPTEAAFGEANRALRQDLIVLGVFSFVALSLAWFVSDRFVLRPVADLVGVTRRLGEGDFSARFAGPYTPNEIGELGRAFDRMAAALAARQAEIEELNATLERRVAVRTADLEEANRELEAFSYSVSHDLRTPLRTIDNFAEILATEHRTALDDEARHYLDVVRGAAQQMSRLIDDLLQFSRIGRSGLVRRPVALEPIVRDALDELAPDMAERPFEIDIQPLGEALVDPALIRQVFVNLLSNAIKFTRGRDPARITIGRGITADGEAVYFVRDNGIGFAAADAGSLFEVFHRLHSQDEYEGTGVGLATAQRIVARHNGRIWAEAEVDLGATFCFTIGEAPEVDA